MGLVHKPTRYFASIENSVECFHVVRDNGGYTSMIIVLNHNLNAEEFANVLMKAACWFVDVLNGKVEPS